MKTYEYFLFFSEFGRILSLKPLNLKSIIILSQTETEMKLKPVPSVFSDRKILKFRYNLCLIINPQEICYESY